MVPHFEILAAGPEFNNRCMSVLEAMQSGYNLDGFMPSLPVALALRDGIITDETMMPVADQKVDVHLTGCTPDQESIYTDTRLTVGACPTDQASRCGNCILRCTGGEELLKSLRPLEVLKVSHSPRHTLPF